MYLAGVKVGFEHAVFFVKVSDHLLLVLLDPASDHRDQEMENHSCSSGSATQVMLAMRFCATVGQKQT
jgi:hypothetical protein